MIWLALAAATSISAAPPVRHPSLEPGSFSAPAEDAAGPRVKPGVTKEGADQGVATAVDQVARRYDLAGEVLVAKGDKVLLDRGYGTIRPDGGAPHKAGERWRLASITKQVTAALILTRIVEEAGASSAAIATALDSPVRTSMGAVVPGGATARQYLTHHTGLPNPDTTEKNERGVPAFYRAAHDPGFCYSRPATPGAPFAYNNCDYLVAAVLLPTHGGWPDGMTMGSPKQHGVPGFIANKPEPAVDLSWWGSAGGLLGTARAVFDFDRSLMSGKLLPPTALAELWKPEGNGSYQALGSWVFPGQLKGCANPKRIVQRDGEIFGVQARNFILPDDDLAVIVFTNRSSDDFPLGEVWEGKGFVYDLLSAMACA